MIRPACEHRLTGRGVNRVLCPVMRTWAVIGIVAALSTVAAADPAKDVSALVAKAIRAAARDNAPDVSALIVPKAVIATADGGAAAVLPRARFLFGADSGEALLEPGTPTVVVDTANHYA